MNLEIDNVGILKNVSIDVCGLSVITGKNSSGKTTVGKTLYSILRANYNAEDSFEQAKKAYLFSKLEKIKGLLYRLNLFANIRMNIKNIQNQDESVQVLVALFQHDFPFNILNKGVNSSLEYIVNIKQFVQKIDYKTYISYFESANRKEKIEKNIDLYQSVFDDDIKTIVEICDSTLHAIQDEASFQQFVKDRTKAFLNFEFHNQIKPVKNNRCVARISINNNDKSVICFKVHNKYDYSFESKSTFSFPVSRAIYIDNPFIIDQVIDADNQISPSKYDRFDDNKESLGSFGITSHNDYLLDLLRYRITDNYFWNRELQSENKSVIEKINSIIPGEFLESTDGLFYIDSGYKLNVQNLATGSKMFSIIKMLLINGYLDKGTILILDEPEAHLHPEWINKFAEIMVLLIKESGTRILLTTHSPNLLMALDVFSKKYNVNDITHFYMAQIENKGWRSQISCIDNNINEGYAHLSIPLIEMSVQREGEKMDGK